MDFFDGFLKLMRSLCEIDDLKNAKWTGFVETHGFRYMVCDADGNMYCSTNIKNRS